MPCNETTNLKSPNCVAQVEDVDVASIGPSADDVEVGISGSSLQSWWISKRAAQLSYPDAIDSAEVLHMH